MSDDQNFSKKSEDTLAVITAQLAELSEKLVGGPRPDDPKSAARYNQSLFWLISHLSEGVHLLNNFMQVLIGRIEVVAKNLNRNEGTNQEILKSTAELTVISRSLVTTAKNIEREVGAVVPDQPILMRNLWWIPTDAVEIGLIVFLLMDRAAFSLRSDTLVDSALFRQLSGLNQNPRAWGVAFGVSALGMGLAFFSRQRKLRRMAVCVCFVLLGGVATRALNSPEGVSLGGAHHLLAALGAAWVLSRGPSNAI